MSESIDLSVYPRGIQFQVECDGGTIGCVHVYLVAHNDPYPNLLVVDSVGAFWVDDDGVSLDEGCPSITRIIGQMEVISNEGDDEVDETFDVESGFVKGDTVAAHWASSVNESIQKLQQQSNSSGELFIIATNLIDALAKQNEQLTAMLNLQLHRSKADESRQFPNEVRFNLSPMMSIHETADMLQVALHDLGLGVSYSQSEKSNLFWEFRVSKKGNQ